MKRLPRFCFYFFSFIALLSVAGGSAQSADSGTEVVNTDNFYSAFLDPPHEARPRVWWHWLNGAVSTDGILRDLAWMDRVGIAGVQVFQGAMPNNDNVVETPLKHQSEEWKAAFRLAVEQAKSYGMEVVIPTSAGWSETGAPFVAAEDGMKKLVWSVTDIVGGAPVEQALAAPPATSGPFGTVRAVDHTLTGEQVEIPELYGDVRTMAFPLPEDYDLLPKPRIEIASGPIIGGELADGNLDTAISLPAPTHSRPAWIQFEYPREVEVRSITAALVLTGSHAGASAQIPARLEVVGADGHFRQGADLTVGAFVQNTSSFAPVRGRKFRVVLQPDPATSNPLALLDIAPGALLQPGLPLPAPQEFLQVSEMALYGGARVHRFEEKAGFATVPDYYAIPTPVVPDPSIVNPKTVLDVSQYVSDAGVLKWHPPAGRWRVIRFGYSLTGHLNGPAPVEATGLEVDKLSAPRVRNYIETYLAQYRGSLGTSNSLDSGIDGLLSDSFEAGMANWTEDLIEQFTARRGYDPQAYMPTLAGYVVGSATESDAFLYDYRRTLAELLAEAHYGPIWEVARERGLSVYGEALESAGRPTLGDDIQMRQYADIPMGAMWTYPPGRGPSKNHIADLKGAASAANLYGKRYVAAESFTSMLQPWAHTPGSLKPVADTMLALGVNRFIIHSSVHQPLTDRAPGLALWIFGQYFNRNSAWAEQAGAWVNYLARSSWLLSQGESVADVAYFYGEEAPLVTLAERGLLEDVPKRYGYDFVNSSALLELFSVENGRLRTPAGGEYAAIQLGGTSRRMTLPVLRKLHELAQAGAVIVGNRPESSPSLADDHVEFERLANRMWGLGSSNDGGNVLIQSGRSIEQVLASRGVVPDLDVPAQEPMSLRFQHRRMKEGHLWFVLNQSSEPLQAEARFRVTGFVPELWDASTGGRTRLPYRMDEGVTIIPLTLDGNGSAMIVFRELTKLATSSGDSFSEREVECLEGEWDVQFASDRGAPVGTIRLSTGSWTESEIAGVRYFSGSAIYRRQIDLPERSIDATLYVDLGEIGDVADVRIDGQVIGSVWHSPSLVALPDTLGSGRHQLEVVVANRWINRLIGDAQEGVEKVAWTVAPAYADAAPLRPAGLMGPVCLRERVWTRH